MRILLTNDDGVEAEGLLTLHAAVRDLGDVQIVAPDREQSGASHALTMSRPLRLRQHDTSRFSVDGTPTDCVLLAVRGVSGRLESRPELVLSGINHGSNLGDDVTYSGTVAAAMEARIFGIAALAFSLESPSETGQPFHWETARAVARTLVGYVQSLGAHDALLINVNVPNLPLADVRGFRVARLGKRTYPGAIVERLDPHGRPYFWVGDAHPRWEPEEDTDYAAVKAGYVALTPLHLDLTDYTGFAALEAWKIETTR